MTFQNTAIKCDTWEQMESLASIAEKQGYRPFSISERLFKSGCNYFGIAHEFYTCADYGGDGYTITTYTTFINSPLT